MSNLPYSLEQDLFDLKNQALDFIKQGQGTDPLTLSRLIGIARTWPAVRPGTALSLAQAGYDRTSPEVKTAADLSMKQSMTQSAWGATFRNHPDKTPGQPKAPKPTALKIPGTKAKVPSDILHDADPTVDPSILSKYGVTLDQWNNARQHYFVQPHLDSSGIFGNVDLGYSASRLARGDVAGALVGPEAAVTTPADAAKTATIGGVSPDELLKTGVREAAATANMPLQGIQGSIRNVASGGNPLFGSSGQTPGYQTDVGQQFSNLTQGKTTDLGNGYLPDPNSPIAKQTVEAQQAAAPTIGGHAFSLGRFTAAQVFEPDTQPFNILSGIVDAGVAVKADPTSAVASAVGDLRAARTTFLPATDAEIAAQNTVSTATGLIPTTSRKFLDQQTKANYLASPSMDATATSLIGQADHSPSRMMRLINNSNLDSPTFPITTVHGQPLVQDLAAANTPEEFKDALARATEVTSALDPPGVSYKLRTGLLDHRIFASMPYGSVADPYDKNTNWKIFDDIMRGANVPRAARDQALDNYLTNESPIAAVQGISDTISLRLQHRYHIPQEDADAAATFFRDAHSTSRAYDVDQLTGVERVKPGMLVAGAGEPIKTPLVLGDGLNSPLQIPDMRNLRRMATDLHYITNTAPWKVTQTALAAPSLLWKPLQVLTARMGVRIFGETQLNLAARGMVNAFTHPVDFIGLLMGTQQDKRWSTLLEKVPGFHNLPAYLNGPDGHMLVGDTDNLLMHSAQLVHDPDIIVTKGYHIVPITDSQAGAGLAERLGKMSNDPIWRGVAQAPDPATAKQWFWDGAGKDARLARAPIVANEDAYNMQKMATNPQFTMPKGPIGDIATSRAAADNYIDQVVYPSLLDMTGGGHPDLMDAVRTGTMQGRPIYTMTRGRPDLGVVDERVAQYAKSLLDQGIGPQRGVPAREFLSKGAAETTRAARYAKTAIDTAFHGLVDLPDRVLNRIPAFGQYQWKNAIDNAPYLDRDGLTELTANATRANIDPAELARLRRVTLDTISSQRLTLDQLTHLAKLNAVHDIKYVVHDLQSRSQFFDMARFLVPFGDAFRLIAARMVKLAQEEPQAIRRVQQSLQELQSPGSATINRVPGDPVPADQGFFHTDPQTNSEVFTFPGSTFLDQSLLGVPIPLQGQVSGLNMIGEGYPGLGGPALTIPAKWFLPDTPTGNQVRDIIFPYGGSESLGPGADIGNTFIPSWLNKVVTGPPDQKTFNSMTLQVMQSLASQGGYDLHNPDDLARLASDAKQDARWLYVIRGAAQFVSPGAPSPDFKVADKTGHLLDTYVLSQKYRDQQTKGGPDKALSWLIDNLGSKNIFLTQAASAPNSYAAPSTKEAQVWVDAHPGIGDKYPLTYGLFAPPGKNFSTDAYNEQFVKGERRTLSPKEQIAQAENRLGFFAYDRKKQEILKANGGTNFDSGQLAWLRDYRAYLKSEFPGFDTFLASPYDSQKRRNSAIEELQRAVKDETILSTSAGRGLHDYLTARAQAFQSAKAGGLASPFQAKKAASLREWLRQSADYVVSQHPEFRPMWEQIFAHEFTTQGA